MPDRNNGFHGFPPVGLISNSGAFVYILELFVFANIFSNLFCFEGFSSEATAITVLLF